MAGSGDRPFAAAAGDTCGTPNQGCACPTEGEVVRCGEVVRRSGAYVSCSEGKRQCVNLTWGACIGDSVAAKSVRASGLHSLGLGAPQACASNPCDPYCSSMTDDASGLDAGAGFMSTDAGLTLTGTNPPQLAHCTGVAITPSAQTVTVTSIAPTITTSPASVAFTATLLPAGCYTAPFQVGWDIDKFDRAVMGSSSSATTLKLLDPLAGTINIVAYVGTMTAIAAATVVVAADETDLAPAGTSGSFGGAGTAVDGDLTLVYPYDKTVYPVAIGAPLVQWKTNGVAANAVKVGLRYPTTGAPVFQWSAIVAESSPAAFQIPQYAWAALDEIARGNDVTLYVQRLVSSTLRQEKSVTIHFSPLGLRGQIFYTDYSSTADVRTFKPGSRNATNVSAYPAGASTGCNNPCHTVSSNGKRLVTSNWYNPWGVSKINADGTTTAISASPSSSAGWDSRGFAYAAVTADGTYALQTANWWGNTTDWSVGGDTGNHRLGTPLQLWQLSDTPGTAPVEVTGGNSWGLGSAALMVPSFSPDGTKLLALDGDRSYGAAWRQGLDVWDFDATAKQFSNPRGFASRIAANEYIRWPAFESDSRSVMFQANPTNADDSSYGGMLPSGFHTIAGKLYSVDSQTANAPVTLDNINVGLGGSDSNLSYQPTMLPISVGGYRWAVFTSSRLYGNTLNNSGTLTTQLWVSAIDDQVSGGIDRSHPPFWLPGQTLGDNGGNRHINERGFWVLDACKGAGTTAASACTSNEECCGGMASPATAICRIDQPAITGSNDTVWVEDALPAGATAATTNESWAWIPQLPAPAFGSAATKSNTASGEHQHYFYGASATMPVGVGDRLYAYVFLDASTPPSEVMLQWHDTTGSWEHRAYWGANSIGWGSNGTTSRAYQGAAPITGQWVRLEVPASAVGMEGRTADGMAFTLYGGQASWDHAGKVVGGADSTWVEDSVPTGATAASDGGDSWNWVSAVPSIPFGLSAHKSQTNGGVHQHYFYDAAQTLSFTGGDTAFTYVWLDPSDTPTEVMLQFHDTSGSWEHRAYWGSNSVGWGNDGTVSRHYMGALPATGQWLRLEVPVEVVGLAGVTIDGMAFTLNGGVAAWDHSGKASPYVLSKHCASVTPPVCAPVGTSCLADSNCCGFPADKCISGLCTAPTLPLAYAAATYTRDYTITCANSTQVKWRFFDWQTLTPGDTRLVFSAQTGRTPATLSPLVPLGIAQGAPVTNWSGVDVDPLFAGSSPAIASDNTMRVSIDFYPSSDGQQAPTLVGWRASYDCVPYK